MPKKWVKKRNETGQDQKTENGNGKRKGHGLHRRHQVVILPKRDMSKCTKRNITRNRKRRIKIIYLPQMTSLLKG